MPHGLEDPELTRSKFSPGFPGGSVVENPSANAEDTGLIPGSGRSPGEENDNPLHILAWEIPWKRSLVGYIVPGVA